MLLEALTGVVLAAAVLMELPAVARATASSAPAAVSITPADHEGRPQLKIATPRATWFYDEAGGGFSRLIDADGRDWISFSKDPLTKFPDGAAAGFRGLGNLVYGRDNPDAGAGHPGFDRCESAVVAPNAIRTVSRSGQWAWTWTFTATAARFHMERVDPQRAWWFLYEGTVGGRWSPSTHYWGTDLGGPRRDAPDNKSQQFGKWRWTYFGDDASPRVFFVAQRPPDDLSDTLWYLGNSKGGAIDSPDGMIVFGLGRGPGAKPLFRDAGVEIVAGFLETKVLTAGAHDRVAALIEAELAAKPAAQPVEVPFERVVVDERPPTNPWYKMAGDLNGNGKLDLIVGGSKGPLVWYAWPDWQKQKIADGGYNGVRGMTGDIDRDGHIDILMGGVVWFRNPGKAQGAWTMHRIDNVRMHDALLVDLDGDGRLDAVGRDQSAFGKTGNAIYLYRQESPEKWTKRVLPCPHGEGIQVADLTGNGRPDIVINGRWYENPGDVIAGDWKEHVYTTAWTHPDAKVELADLNGNGRLDVVLTPAELAGQTYKITWYEAPADPRRGDWTEHIVVEKLEAVIHSLALGDFNRDGRVDIAYAEMHQGADPDEVVLLLNGGRGAAWHKQVLSTRGSHDLLAVDFEGKGVLDLIGANHGGPYQPLELWRNRFVVTP